MEMRDLIHIPRPNQSFHVGFALFSAMILAERNKSEVDILICNLLNTFCPVKKLFERDMIYGECPDCSGGLDFVKSIIKNYNNNGSGKINISYAQDFLDNSDTIKQEEVLDEFREFQLRYVRLRNYKRFLYEPLEYTWLSELMSMKCASALDIANQESIDEVTYGLIELSIITQRCTQKFLSSNKRRKYGSLLTFNARHTHARTFWKTFECNYPKAKMMIHERGVGNNTFQIFDNCSPEATFELLPTEVYQQDIPQNQINEFVEDGMQMRKLTSSKVQTYFMDKLNGVGGFYQKGSVVSYINTRTSREQTTRDSLSRCLILLSSVDEISSPYPIDRVLYEQELIPSIVKLLLDKNIYVDIRCHPRSRTQLERSMTKEGSYHDFIEILKDIDDKNKKLKLYLPKDKVSSYDLMRSADFAFSVYSLSAIEAQALGIPAMVHARARGSNYASGVICNYTHKESVEDFIKWFDYLSKKKDVKEYRRKAAISARSYLINEMHNNDIVIEGFTEFFPYKSNKWAEFIYNTSTTPNTVNANSYDSLFKKITVRS